MGRVAQGYMPPGNQTRNDNWSLVYYKRVVIVLRMFFLVLLYMFNIDDTP